jgi:hypothetical protein
LIAVGDSVMLGARTMLRERMRRAHVDAALSRQVADGLDVLRAMQADDLLGDAVVIHLGNNGSFTSSQFDEMMQILSEVDRIVVVSVKVPRRWEGSVNRTLVEGAERYPSVAFVDWHSQWHSCPGEVFASDGVHLAASGASCYAELIAAAL